MQPDLSRLPEVSRISACWKMEKKMETIRIIGVIIGYILGLYRGLYGLHLGKVWSTLSLKAYLTM